MYFVVAKIITTSLLIADHVLNEIFAASTKEALIDCGGVLFEIRACGENAREE